MEVLAARLALAAVFATAAAAKLLDPSGSRRALAGFGVPDRLARPLAVLVPALEAAVAGMLVPASTSRLGALGSLALLAVFSAAVIRSLLLGRAPECHCFGGLHSAPIGRWTLARNALLVLAGAGVAWAQAPAGAVLGLVAAALGVTLAERRTGGARAPAGLPVGAPAPDFRLAALDGSSASLATVREGGRPALLVFSDPRCVPCSVLAPRLAGWQRELGERLSVWVVARGEVEENRAKAAEQGLANVLLDADETVSEAYRAQGTPSAVLVAADGRIASPVAVAAYGIERLVAETVGSAPPPPPPVAVRRPGASLTRLELLVRAGSAAAAAAGFALVGARDALAGGPIVLTCKYVSCGGRCCPKKATCGTRRGKKVCICPDGREACGGKCCAETFVCRKTARGRRVCVCPPRTRLCRGRCVPVTDPANCGRCGNECPPATTCVNGQCVGGDGSGTGPGGAPPCTCPPGETCCDGACTDLNSDPAHCGRCDQPCLAGQSCCNGVCKDLQLDPANCGECGKRCPAGEVCAGGRCGGDCPPGLTKCGGRCVDLLSDDDNCRECGRKCAEGLTCCGEADCVDTRIRPDHCTACNALCDPFRCNCWDSRCNGAAEDGCWGSSPPPSARTRGGRGGVGSRLGRRRRNWTR